MKTKSKKSNGKKSLVKRVISKITTKSTPEQKEAKKRVKFAKSKGVTTEFYEIGGGVFRTRDGKAYHSPQDFFNDGGNTDWSNVTNIK